MVLYTRRCFSFRLDNMHVPYNKKGKLTSPNLFSICEGASCTHKSSSPLRQELLLSPPPCRDWPAVLELSPQSHNRQKGPSERCQLKHWMGDSGKGDESLREGAEGGGKYRGEGCCRGRKRAQTDLVVRGSKETAVVSSKPAKQKENEVLYYLFLLRIFAYFRNIYRTYCGRPDNRGRSERGQIGNYIATPIAERTSAPEATVYGCKGRRGR